MTNQIWWDVYNHKDVTDEKINEKLNSFLSELNKLETKYKITLSHEDLHGSFIFVDDETGKEYS